MNFFKNLRELFEKNGNLKEESYKQKIFRDFLLYLGYEDNEIIFEQKIDSCIEGQKNNLLSNVRKADIVCSDILFEIKSSNISINDGKTLSQAIEYNVFLNKTIICLSNFKTILVYNRNNELLFSGDLIDDSIEDLEFNLVALLGKFSLYRGEILRNLEDRYNTFKNWISFYRNKEKLIQNIMDITRKNNYNILPLLKKGENNNIYLKFDSNDIKIDVWTEILKTELLNSGYEIIDFQLGLLRYNISELNENFPYKYFTGNSNYVLKDSWLKNPYNNEKIKFIKNVESVFEEMNSTFNNINRIIDETIKIATQILDYCYLNHNYLI